MKLLKKGQVGGLQGFILSIVTVAIVLAVGLIIISELGTVAKEMGTSSVSNESMAISSNVGGVSQGGSLFIGASAVRNESSFVGITRTLIPSSDYNISSVGTLTLDGNMSDQILFVDYTHFTPSAAFNSTGTIITKLATVPTWIGIIIIVSLAFIVLSFFIGKRQ